MTYKYVVKVVYCMNDLNMSPLLAAIKRNEIYTQYLFHNLIRKLFYVLPLLPRLDSIYKIMGNSNLSSKSTESHITEKNQPGLSRTLLCDPCCLAWSAPSCRTLRVWRGQLFMMHALLRDQTRGR
jgi:hypothetical protein